MNVSIPNSLGMQTLKDPFDHQEFMQNYSVIPLVSFLDLFGRNQEPKEPKQVAQQEAPKV